MMTIFDPVKLSIPECNFLLRHLGEPSIVALRDTHPVRNPDAPPKDKNPIVYPDGVIPAAVKPVLDGVTELMDLEAADKLKWVGVEKVKEAIQVYIRENERWSRDALRGAPRQPSLHSFDAKGRPHLGGPGSDSGIVKTYFGPAGERLPFALPLIEAQEDAWVAPAFTEQTPSSGLYIDKDSHRLECRVKFPDGTFCGHTETYKLDSRQSYNTARSRMGKHMLRATQQTEAHRELHTNEFHS